jgi:TRAP-type C4-dicarboxylate transport system substrate-binding protein
MRRNLLIGILVLVGLFLMGTNSNTTAQESKKPIKMVFATYLPTKHHVYKNVVVPFVEQVEKRSKGAIKFDVKAGGSLGKSAEILSVIGRGIASVGQSFAVYNSDVLPLTNVTTLPGILHNSLVGALAIHDLRTDSEIMAEWERQNVYPLALGVAGSRGVISKVPFRKVEDAKNLKIQVSGKQYAMYWEALGARPILGSSDEMYPNIQRGVVDAGSASWASLPGYSLQEIAKYATPIPWGYSPFYIGVNKKVWQELPQWAKDVLKEVGDKAVRWEGQSYEDETTEATEKMKKAGVEIITLSAGDLAKIRSLLEPITEKWINMQTNPQKTKEMVNTFKQLIEKYSKK